MNSMPNEERPLYGLTILDFSQFLAGPLASLKLADLGARVIKVERPGSGDLCRHLYLSETTVDADNTLFHAINRNKESITADLRNSADRQRLFELIKTADVMIQNFRPGVIEKLGFGYDDIKSINPNIIYASISGYGDEGPWRRFPGQDLLAQARSGLLWLNGNDTSSPSPVGLAIADILAGNALVQGILATLVGRGIHGHGAIVETSLLEAMIDFQFEVLTTYLNDGNQLPTRSENNGAHAYLAAPYGVYKTSDSYLVIAMTPSLKILAETLKVSGLEKYYADKNDWMTHRDEINRTFALSIERNSTEHWLALMQPQDMWCAEVLDWPTLMQKEAYRLLNFHFPIKRASGELLTAVRGPLRINKQILTSDRAAPALGEQNAQI